MYLVEMVLNKEDKVNLIEAMHLALDYMKNQKEVSRIFQEEKAVIERYDDYIVSTEILLDTIDKITTPIKEIREEEDIYFVVEKKIDNFIDTIKHNLNLAIDECLSSKVDIEGFLDDLYSLNGTRWDLYKSKKEFKEYHKEEDIKDIVYKKIEERYLSAKAAKFKDAVIRFNIEELEYLFNSLNK